MNDEEVSKEFLGVKLPTFIPEASFGNIMHTPIASFDRNGEGNLNVLCALGIKDVFFKDFKNAPISNLQKVPQNFRYIFSPRDLFHGFIDNSNNGICFDTNAGRKVVNVSAYGDRIVIDKPHAVIALSDEISWLSSRKRMMKSSERSLRWFQALRNRSDIDWSQCFLFGVTCPTSYDADAIAKNAMQLLELGARGIVIGGAFLGESISQLATAITAVRKAVGPSIIIMVQGVSSIYQAMQCVGAGADLLHTCGPTIWSQSGLALTFDPLFTSLSPKISSEMGRKRKRDCSSAMENNNQKKSKLEAIQDCNPSTIHDNSHKKSPDSVNQDLRDVPSTEIDTDSDNYTSCSCSDNNDSDNLEENLQCSLNLWDKSYRRDGSKLVAGCSCIACRDHSRAYIHHLLFAHELLGEVLIHRHNHSQLMNLFPKLRVLYDQHKYWDSKKDNNNDDAKKDDSDSFSQWLLDFSQQLLCC